MLCTSCVCCKKQDQSISPNNSTESPERTEVRSDQQFGFAEASATAELREGNRFNQHVSPNNDDRQYDHDERNKLTENKTGASPRSISAIVPVVQDSSNNLVFPQNRLQPHASLGNPQHTLINVVEKVEFQIYKPQAEAIILGNESSVNIRKDEADKMRQETKQIYKIYSEMDQKMVYMRNKIDDISKAVEEMEKRNRQREECEQVEEPQIVKKRPWSTGASKNTARTQMATTVTHPRTKSWTQNDAWDNSTSQIASAESDFVSSAQYFLDSLKNEQKSGNDTDFRSFHRSGSKRKSKRKLSFKEGNKREGQLQSMRWKQYEFIQELVVKHATVELKNCNSVEELKEKANSLKERLQTSVDGKTAELIQTFSKKQSKAREQNQECQENTSTSLFTNRDEVILDAKEHIDKLKNEQITKLSVQKQNMSHMNERISNEEAAREVADFFILQITGKIEQQVSTLLSLAIQRKIILQTFQCQKSYVIKNIMKEFTSESGKFTESIRYILDPNEYAENWLKRFTNETIFKEKIAGMHFYSKTAKVEIGQMVAKIEKCVKSIKLATEDENICNWVDQFLSQILKLEILPVLEADLEDIKRNTSLDLNRFLLIVNNRLDHIKDGALLKFKDTTEKTVIWADDPHKKIMKKLWGCTWCCPFCHEPCYFTDKQHVKHGQPHKCIQHRPLGVYGFMGISDSRLITKWCGQLIQNKGLGYRFKDAETLRPCSMYKEEFPDWIIDQYDTQSEINRPTFWIWYMCTYLSSLAEVYGASPPELDDEWKQITKKKAVSSLDVIYICR